MAVVVRFVSNEWTLEQRLVKLQMLAKSMKGEEVARELIHILATENAIDPLLVILCRPLLEYSAQVTTYIQVYKLNNC